MSMELRLATEEDLTDLATWFASRAEVRSWGGTNIRYPIVKERLKEDICWEKAISYSLTEKGNLLGFAQLMERFGYIHLCMVVINPQKRGQKLGHRLIELIFDTTQSLNRDYSLFVHEDNLAALALYRKYYFQPRPFPEGENRGPGTLFMVKKRDSRQ